MREEWLVTGGVIGGVVLTFVLVALLIPLIVTPMFDDLEVKIDDLGEDVELKFDSLDNKIDILNESLSLDSEQHQLNMMNKVDESVVAVINYPYEEQENELSSVFYLDESGTKASIGAGVSINEEGYILTAKHVVEGAANKSSKVLIVRRDGVVMPVDDFLWIENADAAILVVESGIPPAEFADGTVPVGSTIGFIGFPLGNSLSPGSPPLRTRTIGMISAFATHEHRGTSVPVYVMHSLVNKGNSGGPIFSMKDGKVIGIVNAGYTDKIGIGLCTRLDEHNIVEILGCIEEDECS